jgi:energy-coupling factor transporter ATP-binding protein EcfA2
LVGLLGLFKPTNQVKPTNSWRSSHMADILVNLDKVSVSFAGRIIFSGLDWEIQAGQRVGLVGPNGAGKSTLFKLIAQELTADEGNIFRQSGLTWGRLPQEPEMPPGATVLSVALTAVPAIAAIEQELTRLEGQMGDPAVYGNPERPGPDDGRPRKSAHPLRTIGRPALRQPGEGHPQPPGLRPRPMGHPGRISQRRPEKAGDAGPAGGAKSGPACCSTNRTTIWTWRPSATWSG